MKRKLLTVFLTLIVTLCLCFALVGCDLFGGSGGNSNSGGSDTEQGGTGGSAKPDGGGTGSSAKPDEGGGTGNSTEQGGQGGTGGQGGSIGQGSGSAGTTTPSDHTHTYAGTWSYDENAHWYAATCSHSNERKDEGAHTYQNGKCTICDYEHVGHTFAEYTEITNYEHTGTCTVCGKVVTEEHSYDAQYQCEKCGYQHTHTFSEEWESNKEGHWHAATCHPEVTTEVSEHILGDDEHCTVCNYYAHIHTYDVDNRCTACGEKLKYTKTGLVYTLNDDKVTYSVAWDKKTALEQVVIPHGYNGELVTSIKKSAFEENSGLTSITIPDGVTEIGVKAFYNCSSLASVTFGENSKLSSIGIGAFEFCRELTSIEIPDSVTEIGWAAFMHCGGLASITIPENVTLIEEYAFDGCSSLASIFVAEENENYSSQDGILYNKAKTELICIPQAIKGSIKIHDGVTSIESLAFEGCSSLTSIEIPNSVTEIRYGAFSECASLTSVKIGGGVTLIEDHAFFNCRSLTDIFVVEENENYSSQDGILYNKVKTEIIWIPQAVKGILPIPDGVTSIAELTFNECRSLEGVTFGEDSQLTSIESSAFYNCVSIESIKLPDGVILIGESAFKGCSSLESVTLGNCVTSIGDGAFYNCSSLTSVTIGNGVTSIGDEAFYNCSSLTSVKIPDSVTLIGYHAFEGCSSLTSVAIGNSVTSIGVNAFAGCSSLTRVDIADLAAWCKIAFEGFDDNPLGFAHHLYLDGEEVIELNIPDSVTEIKDYAFFSCSSLTSVTIPDGVTSIGLNAFWGCSSLTSVTIGNGVTSIGEWAFDYCSSLTNVTIGSGVTSIGAGAFQGCSSLENITIPESVTSIGSSAFLYCSSLKKITIPESVTSIADRVFAGCSSLTSVTIGNGVTKIEWFAFSDCSSLTSIQFKGTVNEWKSIQTGREWNSDTGDYTITCTDGTIDKNGNVTYFEQ